MGMQWELARVSRHMSAWSFAGPMDSWTLTLFRFSHQKIAPKRTIFTRPQHPYTEALLEAVPVPDPTVRRQRRVLAGDVPSPINPPPGCHFHTRCPYAEERRRREEPVMQEVATGQFVACHLRQPPALPVTEETPA